MSYILDALNKAERERGMKHAPTSLVRPDLPAAPGNRSWIIAGVLVAGVAAAVWLFLASQHKDSRPSNPVSAGAERDSVTGPADIDRNVTFIQSNAAPPLAPPTELPVRKSSGLPNETLLAQGSVTRGVL